MNPEMLACGCDLKKALVVQSRKERSLEVSWRETPEQAGVKVTFGAIEPERGEVMRHRSHQWSNRVLIRSYQGQHAGLEIGDERLV